MLLFLSKVMLSNHQNYSPPRSDDHFHYFFFLLLLKMIYSGIARSALIHWQVQKDKLTLTNLIPWHFAFLMCESLLKGGMSSL